MAYQAVQRNDAGLMAETVRQCGLQRAVLKQGNFLNWQHIVGPNSPDSGLWYSGNGWASWGMVRVLHTLQKWPGSSAMTSEANQLKGWIKEILDGAMLSGFENGLLRNYLNDESWFGEISGTALLSAVAYRMAVNDPGMFPQKYITWADTNRKSLSTRQGSDGVLVPAVNPLDWKDGNKYYSGSAEGQAFVVLLYTAFRDCVRSRICQQSPPPSTTFSKPGIGPRGTLTVLDHGITFIPMAPPPTCPDSPRSCDNPGCDGQFKGLTKYPQCTGGQLKGCRCVVTGKVCGARQACDLHGCDGKYNGLVKYPQCTGNFVGCECNVTPDICGNRQRLVIGMEIYCQHTC